MPTLSWAFVDDILPGIGRRKNTLMSRNKIILQQRSTMSVQCKWHPILGGGNHPDEEMEWEGFKMVSRVTGNE
jgi:hypothetical protein